ncbi:MAG: class I SAM-dependent methyltransferase [Bacteriovoracaceae bacterium]|nr:class I SAM-dependent methyltransferase [Bacteriovoracaceae bacterium]
MSYLNYMPDSLIRLGIRILLKQRIRDEKNNLEQEGAWQDFLQKITEAPIAVHTQSANEQHYEVPALFYEKVLGDYLKYSCGLWDAQTDNLTQAEENMLELTCSRAQLQEEQEILELGCGWGSLTLFMAQKYPKSFITAVSNSSSQREFILKKMKEKNITNIEIITQDMNDFQIDKSFDRIVSVEMLEHMRNYPKLFKKVSSFLKPQGLFFVHIFVHRYLSYFFDIKDKSDWMSKYFFTGGIMPSDTLMLYFNEHLRVTKHWHVQGTHYAKTSRAWLENMDKNKAELEELFKQVYGIKNKIFWQYWRIFFMACEELWGYRQGKEWFVSHYLFKKVV